MVSSIEQLQLLRQAGLEQAQAEAILLVVEQKHEDLATKEDIKDFATKQDVKELRFSTQAQLAEVKVDLIEWMVGMDISAIGIGLAGVYFMLAHFRP